MGGAVAGITAASSSEPAGAVATGPQARAGGSAALARPRSPGRPRGRRPPRGECASTRPGRGPRPGSGSHATTRSRRGSGKPSAAWPEDTVTRLTELSGLHPKSAAVQLNLGIARYWAGEAGAKEAWQSAAELEPDTAYAVTAGNLLHPEFARNLPLFVPVAECPAGRQRGSTRPAQFAALERRAQNGSVSRSPLLRRRAAAAREAALRPARLRRGGAPRSDESRGARRRRGRPVRQGTARTRILPARAALADVPERGNGSLPSRRPAALVGAGEGGPPPARAASATSTRGRGSSGSPSSTSTQLRAVGNVSRLAENL